MSVSYQMREGMQVSPTISSRNDRTTLVVALSVVPSLHVSFLKYEHPFSNPCLPASLPDYLPACLSILPTYLLPLYTHHSKAEGCNRLGAQEYFKTTLKVHLSALLSSTMLLYRKQPVKADGMSCGE